MPAPLIVLAHAADSSAIANNVNRRLSTLGYAVEQHLVGAGAPALNGASNKAQRLIVLWSRGAAGANLDASLRRAEAAGKLSVIRLASSPLPARLKRSARTLPRPGEDDATWRELAENLESPPRHQKEETPEGCLREPGSRLHGLLVLVLVGLVAAWAAYVSNTGFAEQVNALFGA
ncbi:MAG: hypothetical protein ABL864_13760 [Terricaulis sp.]